MNRKSEIKRLPAYAERMLELLCSKYGALCHKATEDESGWDYLVEFPQLGGSGPADMHPPRRSAYVQVKSVRNGSPRARIKLSNALSAAKSSQPWFVMLVRGEHGGIQPSIYCRHIWDGFIRQTLEKVRRIDVEKNGRLNRHYLELKFDDAERVHDDIVGWMLRIIDSLNPGYEEKKRQISETVGFEKGFGTGVVEFRATEREKLITSFLGSGDGIQFEKFAFTPQRFGIPSPAPELVLSNGVLHITPQPAAEAELRIRSRGMPGVFVLPAKCFAFRGLDALSPGGHFRVSAEFLELQIRPDGQKTFTAKIDENGTYRLSTLDDFWKLNLMLSLGEIDLQVWIKGQLALGGNLRADCPIPTKFSQSISDLCSFLKELAAGSNPELSLQGIMSSNWLNFYAEVSRSKRICFDIEHTSDIPSDKIRWITYWFCIVIDNQSFFGASEWEVLEDEWRDESTRRLTAHNHRIAHSVVLSSTDTSGLNSNLAVYESHCLRLSKSGPGYSFGDFGVIAERLTQKQIASA